MDWSGFYRIFFKFKFDSENGQLNDASCYLRYLWKYTRLFSNFLIKALTFTLFIIVKVVNENTTWR